MPAKHVYSPDEVKYSDGFAPDRYATADDIREHKRKFKKLEKSGVYDRIREYVETENIMDFCVLWKRIASEFPEYEDALIEKWNMFKGFVDSRRFSAAKGFGTMSYDEMAKAYTQMSKDYDFIRERISEIRETNEELKTENLNLRKYIMLVAGSDSGDENPDTLWKTVDLTVKAADLDKALAKQKDETNVYAQKARFYRAENEKLKKQIEELQKKIEKLDTLSDFITLDSEEDLL